MLFFWRKNTPPLAARILPESQGILYFNLSPLRAATHFDRKPVRHDPDYQRFIDAPGSASPMLVTGSWDKTVKYWDLRQSSPVATLNCQERVYTLDVRDKLMVIGTADRYINIVNLSEPTKFYKSMQSPLKWQPRTVSCFADSSGFAVGSIEGRCAIQYVEEKDQA